MSTRALLELFGWISSGLIVLSLAQGRVWRFRIINFVGAFMATIYNALLGIWPFAAMNLIITVLDAYWIARLRRERDPASAAYSLLEVGKDDAYVNYFLEVHGPDAKKFFPEFDPGADTVATVLVMRGDETVGVVTISDVQEGTARLGVDYATERFRDFSPGRFVYNDSRLFERLGVSRIQAPTATDTHYLSEMGFTQQDGRWIRPVAA
jgi:hypothetical protein